ncbi:MAG: sensor histidine kinase [Proteocatella sp.]
MSYKNKKLKPDNLLNIITKKYVLLYIFITVLFIIVYGVISLTAFKNNPEANIRYVIDKVSLGADDEILYLDFEKYLGEDCKVIILDEYARTIYANDTKLISDYLISELSGIPYYYDGLDVSSSNNGVCKYKYNIDGNSRTIILKLGKFENNSLYLKNFLSNYFGYMFSVICIISGLFFVRKSVKDITIQISPINLSIESMLEGSKTYLGTYSNSTEINQIAKNLDNLADSLIKIEWERARFDKGRQKLLSDISHDLKTPMTVIQGYAIALRDGILPKEQQQIYLEMIYKKSQHITELLYSFHEYSKLDHPDFPVNLKVKNLGNETQIYLAEKYYEIELSGFFMEVYIPEDVISCEIDCKLFYRAIDNIINNSLKYNSEGTIIKITLLKFDSYAKIIIGDNGVGISKNLIKNIFEPFSTGDESRGKNHGSGLGLAITQKIITAHNGNIILKYPVDTGLSTQFEITLPLYLS